MTLCNDVFDNSGLYIGSASSATLSSSIAKYYAIPLSPGGLTIRLDVSLGNITCYASDTDRHPNTDNNIWQIGIVGYASRFIDQGGCDRSEECGYIYIAIVGVRESNSYRLDAVSGDLTSQGEEHFLLPVLCFFVVFFRY